MSEQMNIRNPLHIGINAYSVVSVLSRDVPLDDAELKKFAARLMTAISEECLKRGAKDVGHIKGYIEHDTGFLFVDTLGDPSDVTIEGRSGPPAACFRIVINSVIYGLSEEKIEQATDGALESVSVSFGLKGTPEHKKTAPIKMIDRRTD